MSHIFQCGENTGLVSYLYDECDPAERAAIDSHVAVCGACAAELAALESARLELASWTPPEAELRFQIARPHRSAGLGPDAGARPASWFSRPLPAWAQAAAACLILAAGLWLGVVRGSMTGGSPSLAATGPAPAATPAAASSVELAALERRLRAEMSELRAATVNSSTTA